MYQGQFFNLKVSANATELVFDSQLDKVNILCKEALIELEQCVTLLEQSSTTGLVIRSAKKVFSAGADVKAFQKLFTEGEQAISDYLEWVHSIYNRIEDLSFPKVAIINGTVAGGGMELALLAEYRLATQDTKMSLPEVQLGIMPGWGGVTRLPRITSLDSALQWLTTGKKFSAKQALEHHVVDGVIDTGKHDPIEQALKVLQYCHCDDFDWIARQQEKQVALPLNDHELAMSLNVARGMAAKVAGPHYPAPSIILNTIEKSARAEREQALKFERDGIVQCAESGVADALVNVFLSDMKVKGKASAMAKKSQPIEKVGVIGAGIMGGGIAYVTADKGLDVTLKDINKQGLDLGLNEATTLLSKQVTRGRKTPTEMGNTLNRIVPTLYNEVLQNNDLMIEAVVEIPAVKARVLAELESIAPDAIIASNTSTLNISELASVLKKPENFCGIHFFNPVHKMPLVEVIRGEKSSEKTIATAVKYVLTLGKTPIVVNDCAGFLVNRCLTPYFLAFNQLLVDGGDMQSIDKTMSRAFGWPMGPALLLDVIGLDTAAHCIDVMDSAFTERLQKPKINLIQLLVDSGFLGQKSKHGFYTHQTDSRGRIKQSSCQQSQEIVAAVCATSTTFNEQDISMRMMLPMIFEAIRCLSEGIVSSAEEADIAFVYGTGFPPFRGGIFHYVDTFGLRQLVEIAQSYEHLGALYQIPQTLIERAENNQNFYA